MKGRIDREEQIVRWYERRKDALLLLALRQTEVKDQVEIEPEAVRKLYDERPELFTAPEEVTLQEIMVQTREEAVGIKERESRRVRIWERSPTNTPCGRRARARRAHSTSMPLNNPFIQN